MVDTKCTIAGTTKRLAEDDIGHWRSNSDSLLTDTRYSPDVNGSERRRYDRLHQLTKSELINTGMHRCFSTGDRKQWILHSISFHF